MTTSKQNKVIFDVTGPRSLDRKHRSSSDPEEDISNIISHVESRACEASVASDISALTDGEFFSVPSSSKNKNFKTMARAPEPPTVTPGSSKLTDIQSETTATTDSSVSKSEKSPKNRSTRRSVSFCEVQIREYERVLEFNPSVTSGPAVGIGWNYSPDGQVFTLDDFEDSREFRRCHSVDEIALPRDQRERMLRTLGYTQREIAASVRSILKTKNQRKQTVQNLHAANYEEMVEKAKRKVKNVMFSPLRTSSKKVKKPYSMHSSHKDYESPVLQKTSTTIIYSSAA